MAASEDELEPLVFEARLVHDVLRNLLHLEQIGLGRQCMATAKAIDGSVAGSGHEPRTRVGWVPGFRPALGRDGKSSLRGLLGEVEIAEEADQRGEHAAPFFAEGLLEDGYHSMIGRTSMAPPRRAAGICAASSMAASRSSTS